MAFKKADMFVIRGGDQRVDLYSKVAPVFEEKLDRRQGQIPPDEPAHELSLGDPFLPTLNDFLVESVNEGLGFVRAHLDAELRRDVTHDLLASAIFSLSLYLPFLSFRAQRETSDPSRSLGMTTDVWHIATDAFEYSGLGPIEIVDKAAVIDAAQNT